MPSGLFRIEPLGRDHNRAAFTCGVEQLDRYIRQHARQNVEQRVAAVFVLVEAANERIAGYYTLSSGAVSLTDLPTDLQKKVPRYPDVPVVLLGRLAIDLAFRGQGLGETLLIDALGRALRQSAEVAAIAVVVDAKDDAARAFYERYDFERFVNAPHRLFLSMRTIERLVEPT